jgi:hypothetical protein
MPTLRPPPETLPQLEESAQEHEPQEESGRAMDKEGKAVTYLPISDFPGYRVGDDGSVWTQWEKVVVAFGAGCYYRVGKTWKRLKTTPIGAGYPSVHLFSGGVAKLFCVHRLVLETFVGLCPKGMECCHAPDPDKTNCRLENLRWDTRGNNHRDRSKVPFPPEGKVCPRCGIRKPLSEFGQHKRRKHGVASWCFVCDRAYQVQLRKMNHERATN